MYFSVLQCKCIFFTNDWKWGKKKNQFKVKHRIPVSSNSSQLFLHKVVQFPSKKKSLFFYLSPNADMLPGGKWVGLEFAVYVSFVLHLILLQTFFFF